MKIKAAILVKNNHPLVLDEIELTDSLKCGQVLVKVLFSGICGSQIGEIKGVKGHDPYLPHLLGHEGTGVAMDIGPGVKYVQKDDHVVLHWKKGNGIDAEPPDYCWKGKKLNAGFVTTFNEYAVVSENRLTTIPKDFDLESAALFGCAVTTGFGVVTNNAHLKIGESIVVFGAGGIGLNIIQAASLTSAYPVIAVDIFDNKLKLAKKMGATHTFNSNKCNISESITNIIGRQGADVCVDNTGIPKVIELAYELTHPQGKTILVGVPPKGKNISIYSLPLHFGKTLTGSFGGETNPSVDIPRYIKLAKAGKLDLDSLITDRFLFPEINTAIKKLQRGRINGRAIIKIGSSRKRVL